MGGAKTGHYFRFLSFVAMEADAAELLARQVNDNHNLGHYNALVGRAFIDRIVYPAVARANARATNARRIEVGELRYLGVPFGGPFPFGDKRATPAAHECLKLSYCMEVSIEFKVIDKKEGDQRGGGGGGGQKTTHTSIFRVPLVVKSELCKLHVAQIDDLPAEELRAYELDCGGYFIIKGNRLVITSQIARSFNTATVTQVTARSKQAIHLPAAICHADARSYNLR